MLAVDDGRYCRLWKLMFHFLATLLVEHKADACEEDKMHRPLDWLGQQSEPHAHLCRQVEHRLEINDSLGDV